MSVGASTIRLRSIKSSLPSLYTLRHSRDKLFQCVSVSVCPSVSLSVSQCVSQFVSVSVCQCVSLLVCQFVSVSVCQFVSLSVCQFVSLSVCQSGEKFLNLNIDGVKQFPKLTVALTL